MENDLEEFKQNILQFSNQRLCEVVVSSRYLNTLQEEALICMVELARRRDGGDNFNFEEYISSELKKLPSFELDMQKSMDINNILRR